MPDWEDDYNASVLRARNAIMGKQGRTAGAFLQIYRAVGRSLIDLQRQIDNRDISDLRSAVIRRNLNAMLQGLRQQIPEIVEDNVERAALRAIQGHVEGLQKAMSSVDPPRDVVRQIENSALFTQPETVAANAMEYYPIRQGFTGGYNYKTLINLGIDELQDNVDDLIASGIQRGRSAENLTRELGQLMSKNDPDFNRVLRQLGPRGGRLRNQMKKVDLSREEIKRAKKFLFQARRIAVSEINNAYNEADRLSSVESQVVNYNRWEVSGRHYGLPTTPDECTFNAEHDQYGLGVGVFYPETTPPLMHPFCGCYTSKVMAPPNEWLEPNPTPKQPKQLSERGFRDYFKDKSTKQRNNIIDTINEKNQQSFAFWQQLTN